MKFSFQQQQQQHSLTTVLVLLAASCIPSTIIAGSHDGDVVSAYECLQDTADIQNGCAHHFCSWHRSQCENADCLQLKNPPWYICDCDYGYIPTADPDICIAGQAYDNQGDKDLCQDNAYCIKGDSTCDASQGYVECICNTEQEFDPISNQYLPKVVQQDVVCATGHGQHDSTPCVDPNFCDPAAECRTMTNDATRAECVCPPILGYEQDELILLPGFLCPREPRTSPSYVSQGQGEQQQQQQQQQQQPYYDDPCSPNHCDEGAVCVPSPDTGGAECHCPGGQVLRPYYECPEVQGYNNNGPTTTTTAMTTTTSTTTTTLTCMDEPCHYSTPCVEHYGGIPKCQCPNGLLVDAGKDCPTDHLKTTTTTMQGAEAEAENTGDDDSSLCATISCPADSICSMIEVDPTTTGTTGTGTTGTTSQPPPNKKAVCICNDFTELAGQAVLPVRGVCQDLCHEKYKSGTYNSQTQSYDTYNGGDRVNPCAPNVASCQMVQGWARCICPGGHAVLHHENC